MPLIILTRLVEFYYVKVFGAKTFSLGGKKYRHFYHLENPTFKSERSVEIAIALDAVNGIQCHEVLEVGNVLSNYGSFQHDVLDKYEVDHNVLNEDVVTFNPKKKYSLILCISTMEHVGWDETPREKGKIRKAIGNLKTLLSENGCLLITVPMGYNHDLDEQIAEDFLGMANIFFMKRDLTNKKWREVDYNDVKNDTYGNPFKNASAIMVADWVNAS